MKKEKKQAILDAYKYSEEEVPLSEILVDEVQPDSGLEQSHENLGHASNVVLNKFTTLKDGKNYRVIDGRKTVNALLNLKKETVKARVYSNLPEKICNMILLVKNLQQSPSPIVEAEAIKENIDKYKMTLQEISETTGIAPSVLSQRLSLLDLPKSIQEQLRKNQLTYSVARKIHSMPKDVQNKIAKEENITGEVVEKYHRSYLNSQLSFKDIDLPEKPKGAATVKNYNVKIGHNIKKMTRRELLSGIDEMLAGLAKDEDLTITRI